MDNTKLLLILPNDNFFLFRLPIASFESLLRLETWFMAALLTRGVDVMDSAPAAKAVPVKILRIVNRFGYLTISREAVSKNLS